MDWLTLLVIPVVVGVIVLVIEYYVIQPLRRAKEIPLPIHVNRDWGNAIRRAVKEFKAQQSGFENEGFLTTKKDNSKTIKVEECTIYKGRAILIVSVSYLSFSGNYLRLQDIQYWDVVRKYRLEVDRTGDILKSSEIDIQQAPISENIPSTKLTVLNIHPSTGKTSKGAEKVLISFDIRNDGQAGKACPHIEYPVVFMSKSKYEPTTFTASLKEFDIPALSTVTIKYEQDFEPLDFPIVNDISKIKIKL